MSFRSGWGCAIFVTEMEQHNINASRSATMKFAINKKFTLTTSAAGGGGGVAGALDSDAGATKSLNAATSSSSSTSTATGVPTCTFSELLGTKILAMKPSSVVSKAYNENTSLDSTC